MNANWSTRFYDKVSTKGPEAEPLKYDFKPVMVPRHSCTDVPCGLVFIAALVYGGYIMTYAFQNGDPRKVTHGIDYEGRICGVDLPWKPYVYWCKSEGNVFTNLASVPQGATAWADPTNLDFEHPICVEECPQSAAESNLCYDQATGGSKSVADYATHAIAKRYCFPQAQQIMDKISARMGGHPIAKYIPQIMGTFRTNWQLLLGAFFMGIILSSIYLLLIECLAGVVIWGNIILVIVVSGCSGGYLLYASQNGGIDGMPNSGDAQTDLHLGIISCVTCAFFLCIACCMTKAIGKAIDVVEAAAACLFECKSLLFEPLINLTARITLWCLMLNGLAWLLSVGEVRKSKIYRTFTYSDEEWVYIGSYIFLMIWLNDFCTAMSQYVIANAAARWYFTEHSGGMKLAPNCLLCKGYFNGWFYHFGSLALGSCVIAFTRPIRTVVLVFVYAEEVVDNAACSCISRCCFCCVECFNGFLVHLNKNAYIDMAITSNSFCHSGANAALLIARQSKTLIASAGATWLFTIVGLLSVSITGAFTTFHAVQNIGHWSRPTSAHYVQDPMVCSALAGAICFFVALCFMIVFDSVSDTMILCLAYDREEQKSNPVPINRVVAREMAGPPPGVFASVSGWFGSQPPGAAMPLQQQEFRRPEFTPARMQNW